MEGLCQVLAAGEQSLHCKDFHAALSQCEAMDVHSDDVSGAAGGFGNGISCTGHNDQEITVTLENMELWKQFNEITNEMIVTKAGRYVHNCLIANTSVANLSRIAKIFIPCSSFFISGLQAHVSSATAFFVWPGTFLFLCTLSPVSAGIPPPMALPQWGVAGDRVWLHGRAPRGGQCVHSPFLTTHWCSMDEREDHIL